MPEVIRTVARCQNGKQDALLDSHKRQGVIIAGGNSRSKQRPGAMPSEPSTAHTPISSAVLRHWTGVASQRGTLVRSALARCLRWCET